MFPSFALRLERDEDQTRFTRLYQRNQRQLHRLAARFLGPGPRAEDIVHDTFIKLIQNYSQLRSRSDGQLERWMMAVARNASLDVLRKEGRETELEAQAWEPAVPADQGEFEALVALIRSMPEDYRRVLELRFLAEWSLADIARELGLTEGAVKSRIFRGRKVLIDTLRKEGYLDGRSCI
ncbi:RNA polymerase sigma factor [uncultured Oscillibacter sp.]|uniref:RNA polymerase sigma factor n=1 Tax=uncultured Oscillibacter sp. TaxID=876091 RepID=UPI00262A9193|nr:sigma-70 family RNA polymerase sigma factor [uncultured Oscillibacter sp.]